jgi:hypothetical protein
MREQNNNRWMRRNRKCHRALPFALANVALVMFASSLATAGDDPSFAVYKLSVPDYLQHHWIEDLDNDGLKDILVVHRKGLPPDETRWVSIFRQGADGSFPTAADQSWELDSVAVILDIGDVQGDLKKEICYVTAKDVRYYRMISGEYAAESQRLLDATGLAVFPSKRGVPLVNFVRDWNDSGRDDVAVFAFEGLNIYSVDAKGEYTSLQQLRMDLETRVGRGYGRGRDDRTLGLYARFYFPDLTLSDFNGDGRDDLVTMTDDRVHVHLRGADGGYSPDADHKYHFDVLTKQEKIEGQAEVSTDVIDLDGNGFADVVVSKQTFKGLTNVRGVVNVYWGGPDGYPATPDQVIISEGTASVGSMFWDVNGDGAKDLVLPSIKFSIAAVIRILITRSIKVYFNIYLLGEDGRFSDRPDFTKEIKFKIDFSGESDDQATDLEGDYNGDRRTDFVFATEEDELSIYLGIEDKDRLFSKKAVAKVKADAYGELSSHDLNNDGYSDMVIYYPQSKERKGTLEVLVNLGRW